MWLLGSVGYVEHLEETIEGKDAAESCREGPRDDEPCEPDIDVFFRENDTLRPILNTRLLVTSHSTVE